MSEPAARSSAGESNGGSAWESNPAPPRERGATDFEDREGRRAPFASGNPCTPCLAFDQADVARPRTFLRIFRGEFDPLTLAQ
jgi:hypothetical protein